MESWGTLASQLIWRTALAAIPLTLIVAAVCRWMPSRPATRHTLWLVLLAWFLISPVLPGVSAWDSLASKFTSPSALLDRPAALPSEAAHQGGDPAALDGPPPDARDDIGPTPPRYVARPDPIAAESPSATIRSGGPRPLAAIRTALGGALDRALNGALTMRYSLIDGCRRVVAALPRMRVETREAMPSNDDLAVSAADPSTSLSPPITEPAEDVTAAQPPIETQVTAQAPPTRNRWSEWMAGLFAVRDAIARLPSVPPLAWLAGMTMLCCGHLLRVLLFRRRMRETVATPPSVVALVRRCARRIGLSRLPEVQMTAANVSPMIWCGRRPRLILPTRLWSQLDEVGREAIVCHELAHLRRRDHWWCWGDLIVGIVYWWHPLVWWARRRLHEEAELSCDAWVVWLLPHGRRAYAESLLRTNQYVGRAYRVGPAVGMAVASGRTRRFARRLTMVMTQSTRPRMSISGLTLAGLIAAASWAVVPARSCPPQSPPEGTRPGEVPAVPFVADVPALPAQPSMPVPPVPPAPFAPVALPGVALTVGTTAPVAPIAPVVSALACPPAQPAEAPRATGRGASAGRGRSRNLGVSEASGGSVYFAQPGQAATPLVAVGRVGAFGGGDDDRIARLEKRVAELTARVEELLARTDGQPRAHIFRTPAPTPPAAPFPPAVAQLFSSANASTVESGPTVVATYKLPKGKLDALMSLMVRSDVPIHVRNIPGGIEVHATQAQHEVFKAFIRMIDPKPTPAPGAGGRARTGAGAGAQPRANRAREHVAALRERLQEVEKVARDNAAHRQAELETREQEIVNLRERADQIREQAESARKQAEELGNESDDGAGKADAEAKAKVKAKAKALRSDAEGLERQTKSIEDEQRKLEKEAQKLEKLGDSLSENAEALNSLRDTLEEARPEALTKALRDASKSLRGETMQKMAESLRAYSDAVEKDVPAKINDALKSLGERIEESSSLTSSKAIERLCEALRERLAEAEARVDSEADEDSTPDVEQPAEAESR